MTGLNGSSAIADIYSPGIAVRAATRAQQGGITWLTDGGEQVAAVVPVEAARAWLEAQDDLEEITRITGRLRDLVQVYDRAQKGGSEPPSRGLLFTYGPAQEGGS
jgi:antitoxin (DNA-binding transcriptional repressor) of toxin-antitoxin stability system